MVSPTLSHLTSSSIVMQKLRIFPRSQLILDSARQLSSTAEHPLDTYLQHIARLQGLFEATDDILQQAQGPVEDAYQKVVAIQTELDSFKSALTFPLSDCCKLCSILDLD